MYNYYQIEVFFGNLQKHFSHIYKTLDDLKRIQFRKSEISRISSRMNIILAQHSRIV